MNKLKAKYLHDPRFFILTASVLIVALSGFSLSLLVLISTIISDNLANFEFCLQNSCVSFFLKKISNSLLILSATGGIIAGIITLGGISIALLSYQNSVKTSALTNHLAHLSIFTSYVRGEIEKRSRLSITSIDTLKWYNFIYPNSKTGRLEVSEKYANFIRSINCTISASNDLYSGANQEKYLYKTHQGLMIDKMKDVGFSLNRLPRLDFNEVESQLLDLIYTINRSFCSDIPDEIFFEREYK